MSSTRTFAHVVFQTGGLAQVGYWYYTVLDAHAPDEIATQERALAASPDLSDPMALLAGV
ncbi:hypothetical protein RVF83_15825 [Gordonia rubripertincta]|uniref:Uncharacterized protein n=2 Tax=Gordonia rubripertincta TaxID=36822 RepID=A0AAW6RCS0_GORRU|nr:hypothetical protein [Gordonia rubripertincta]MDG6783774.1 hypothetical protein [Gordonia rubripertincta]NKY65988.1 hypothetical protein [Gordonia rubripertincta]GAB86934.1 hypothetical protein GORBP_084_00090 [Gordonia rubripertincta NBRC 101908]